VTGFLSHFHGPVIYLIVVGLLVAESGFGVGFFVPGELAMVLGGVLAREHRVDIVVMVLVANAGAIGSYLLGYGIGRAILPWVLEHTRLGRSPLIHRAREQLARRGGPAVFIARFVVVARAVMPALAGLSDLRLRTFVLFDIAGGIIWATLYTLLGFALGLAYTHVLKTIGVWSYVVIGVIVVALVLNHVRMTRRHRRQDTEDDGG
jgi:membrane protein DedA with SNARE-associated domain